MVLSINGSQRCGCAADARETDRACEPDDEGRLGGSAMMEYRVATVSDIDALIKSRLEVLRIVNDLEDDYVFGEDFVQASRDYFLKADQITVFALHDNIIVGCGSICFMELMPTFSHPSGKRAHLMNAHRIV